MTLDDLAKLYRRNDCPSGKVAHPTKQDAERAANRMVASPKFVGDASAFRVFHCDKCGLWHTGNWTRGIRNRIV